MMQVPTRQFGIIEVADDDVVTFPKGLLGFEGLERYTIVDNQECHPFRWLQSLDVPELSFVIVSPVVFFPGYRVAVHAKEVADIAVADPLDVEIYVIVTVPTRLEEMTANLQGPILLNTVNRRGKQLVLTDSAYTVCHSVVEQLERLAIGSASRRTPVNVSP